VIHDALSILPDGIDAAGSAVLRARVADLHALRLHDQARREAPARVYDVRTEAVPVGEVRPGALRPMASETARACLDSAGNFRGGGG
jgi:hypothetical protein